MLLQMMNCHRASVMSKVLAGQYISDEVHCDDHFNELGVVLLEVLNGLLNCCLGLMYTKPRHLFYRQ